MKIEHFKNDDEKILWEGKPNKKVFIRERIFSPLLPFVLVWLLVDLGILIGMFSSNIEVFPLYFIIPFFVFHLFPVWLYLGSVIFSSFSWKNTEYMVTDKAVYSLCGVFTTNNVRQTFQEITNISFRQGIIDKLCDVGDISIATAGNGARNVTFHDVDGYLDVYKLITNTGKEVFSDTMYPNELRPNKDNK